MVLLWFLIWIFLLLLHPLHMFSQLSCLVYYTDNLYTVLVVVALVVFAMSIDPLFMIICVLCFATSLAIYSYVLCYD